MNNLNSMLLCDGYKTSHKEQYPPGTTLVYSNFTPRKSRVEGVDYMVFFGLQYAIREYLINHFNENFFSRNENEVVEEYNHYMDAYLGPDSLDVSHIRDLHKLGYLPLHIKAVKEGTKVPLQTPCMTLYNTKPEFFWVTNYIETLLSALLWKPCTSATTAVEFKRIFTKYAEDTGGDLNFIPFQGHDFSFRGMSGVEDAVMSGGGHLLSFVGTDTIPAINFLERYYGADVNKELVGCSVPASEHSVLCSGGKDNEVETINRLLDTYPKGIFSLVSDTWDLFKLVNEYLPSLKDKIMARDGKLVCRPDSGSPHLIVNGDPNSDCELERMGVLRLLDKHFGSTVNAKGFKELDPHVGLIYGDGIDRAELIRILEGMKENGYASTNIVIGLGSYTYEYVTRDTFGTVCKATYVEVDGEARPIWKSPKTGAWKNSHKGLLRVNKDLSVDQDVSWAEEKEGVLSTVFFNGTTGCTQSLSEIREYLKGQV